MDRPSERLLAAMALRSLVAGLGRVLLVSLLCASAAQAETADELFARVRERVVQVKLIDRGAEAKASIGSGFFVTTDGVLLTNYHVVAEALAEPERYRLELVGVGKEKTTAKVLAVDVVHDLALLRASTGGVQAFTFLPEAPVQGTRIYSLGNPLDLGSSIVEGIYNGITAGSLYGRIHLTAPINRGMSGGPALTADGFVIGVNVATAGNEVGFLVPGDRAKALVDRHAATTTAEPADLREDVRRQLLANQERLVEQLLRQPFGRLSLGAYEVPIDASDMLNCWGTTEHGERKPYEIVQQHCVTREEVFVGRDLEFGELSFRHQWIRSDELSAVRFQRLLAARFQLGGSVRDFGFFLKDDDDISDFECTTDFVDLQGTPYKAVACLRAYRKWKGLYDLKLSLATLPAGDDGIVSKLSARGVTVASARSLAQRYLEVFQRKP